MTLILKRPAGTRLILKRPVGAGLEFTPGQPVRIDPYRSDVVLHITGEGANNSISIVDSSPTPKAITSFGDTKITTAIADPFERSAGVLQFDGAGDYLTVEKTRNDFNFSTGDFSIEAWIKPLSTNIVDFSIIAGRGPTQGTIMFVIVSNQLRFGRNLLAWDAQSLNLNWAQAWYHVAAIRYAGVLSLFRAGDLVGSAGSVLPLALASDLDLTFAIGARQSSNLQTNVTSFYAGEIKDLVVTRRARYTTGTGANAGKMVHIGTNTLALPTAPFPVI